MSFDLVPVTVIEFYLGVTKCPPGAADHATHRANRGHDDWPEVTCWPKNEVMRLTTGREFMGKGIPDPVRLNEAEKQMARILDLTEEELGIFLRSWQPPTHEIYQAAYSRPQTVARLERERPKTLKQMKKALQGTG